MENKVIKISFSKRTGEILERESEQTGLNTTEYCKGIIIENLKKRNLKMEVKNE